MKSYIVQLKSGEQYLCPSLEAAQETCEARGGVIVEEVTTRWCEYRYRANEKERWGNWPAWKEAE